jgi:hypothetical protein
MNKLTGMDEMERMERLNGRKNGRNMNGRMEREHAWFN